MRTIVYSLLTAVSGIVLLLSYRASAADLAAVDTAPASPSQLAGAGAGTDGAPAPAATAPPAGLRDGTYTGAASMTRFGPVQVQITVASGAVTDVNVLQHPDSNGQDQWINARALPILITETTAAQSASIDMVSGATYTSRGYRASLQSALDQAQA